MKFDTRITDSDRLAFIADCELADCTHSSGEHNAPADQALAAVVGSNLLAFAEGVSSQNKQDVMDSFLFATLVANKAFQQESETQQWYARFNQVLATLGWLSADWRYARYRSTQQSFTMEQVALEILGSAIAAAALPGPASLAMLAVAGDAVKALQAQEKPLRLFESQSKSQRGAKFRIGACVQPPSGEVHVAMGAVNFLANSSVKNVLFWEWSSIQVETFRGADHLILNADVYANVRDSIKRRLAGNALSAIEEFEI